MKRKVGAEPSLTFPPDTPFAASSYLSSFSLLGPCFQQHPCHPLQICLIIYVDPELQPLPLDSQLCTCQPREPQIDCTISLLYHGPFMHKTVFTFFPGNIIHMQKNKLLKYTIQRFLICSHSYATIITNNLRTLDHLEKKPFIN